MGMLGRSDSAQAPLRSLSGEFWAAESERNINNSLLNVAINRFHETNNAALATISVAAGMAWGVRGRFPMMVKGTAHFKAMLAPQAVYTRSCCWLVVSVVRISLRYLIPRLSSRWVSMVPWVWIHLGSQNVKRSSIWTQKLGSNKNLFILFDSVLLLAKFVARIPFFALWQGSSIFLNKIETDHFLLFNVLFFSYNELFLWSIRHILGKSCWHHSRARISMGSWWYPEMVCL